MKVVLKSRADGAGVAIFAVRYIRLPDLLVEISVARANGTYRDYMKKLRKEKLLILDEWLLLNAYA
ncbi:hypothetical protein [Gemmiger formicilis]|uniref:hypothetical protein n=1 Tax=Gemmiger formicilis TaxID=745368 RepID=UPI001FAF14C0|nr:hypothetical protein [Gemmiger formicilis]